MARTKATNGAGGIRTRTTADGRTVYDVNWSYRDTILGARRRTEKRGFRTRREAEQFRRRVTAQVDSGTFVAPAKATVAEYLATYLVELRHKPQTLAKYRRDARLHITPDLGHLRLTEVTLNRPGSGGGSETARRLLGCLHRESTTRRARRGRSGCTGTVL